MTQNTTTYKTLLFYNKLTILLKRIYEAYDVSYYESSKGIDGVFVDHLTCLISEEIVLKLLKEDLPKLNLFGTFRSLSYRMYKISKNNFESANNSLTYFLGNDVPKTLDFYNNVYKKLEEHLKNIGTNN